MTDICCEVNNQMDDQIDNQTVLSDITDNTTLSDFDNKFADIFLKLEKELNLLTIENIKEKLVDSGFTSIPKMKKKELIERVLENFTDIMLSLKNKKLNELKSICKQYCIKGITSAKKDVLILQIMSYLSLNYKFRLIESDTQTQTTSEEIISPQLSLIEQLEKQKQEIEKKMQEEIEKAKIIELEKLKQEEIEKAKLAEIERLKQEELEKAKLAEIEKQKQEEKAELKRKKQSIPKNVRIIVWNHYIGEDIIKHKCLCCKKVIISNTNFEVGHVLSEKNGGTHEINNLRPICFACNHSMGAENMVDFVVKYGLYIG